MMSLEVRGCYEQEPESFSTAYHLEMSVKILTLFSSVWIHIKLTM